MFLRHPRNVIKEIFASFNARSMSERQQLALSRLADQDE
jgi:hypothetical protein